MSKFVIYDKIENHFPKDYQYTDILPEQIRGLFCSLLCWMDSAPEKFGYIEMKLVKKQPRVGFGPLQLDSSMFTDLGNELMTKCYDRWISSVPVYSTGKHPYQYNSVSGTSDDIRFTEFETTYKKMCGCEPFKAPEPNLKDAYGYSVGEITGEEPKPFVGMVDLSTLNKNNY